MGWATYVYIYYSNMGYGKTEAPYPGTYKFSDEGSTVSDGNLIQYVTNQISMSILWFLYLMG